MDSIEKQERTEVQNSMEKQERTEVLDSMEKIEILDADGNKTGKIINRGEDLEDGEFFLAAVIIIQCGEKFIITKRHKDKSHGNKWEFPGGGVIAGEESNVAAQRELQEETGIIKKVDQFQYLGRICNERHQLFMDVYVVEVNPCIKVKDIKLQENETVAAKIVTVDEIEDMYEELTELDQMLYDEFVLCME